MKQTLRSILDRARTSGVSLADALADHDDLSVATVADAEALAAALAAMRITAERAASLAPSLHALVGLLQEVDGEEAGIVEVVHEHCLPEALRLVDELLAAAPDAQSDLLLFLLKILSMYGGEDAAERVLAALRRPVDPSAYLWSVIFRIYNPEHPQRDMLLDRIADALPGGFAGVALLDTVNEGLIAGEERTHPFDSPQGKARLRDLLQDPDPDHASYAVSVTAALPFISRPEQDHLLSLAMEHADAAVRLEACWAAARMGREAGIRALARLCLDVNRSVTAQQYLTELDRADAIPPEALTPAFQARADFARWLAHPNELGRPADSVELLDQRLLAWPPDGAERLMSLVGYRIADTSGFAADDVGCGVVGSMTFCFFGMHMADRHPEDAYALHCVWEMRNAKHLTIDEGSRALVQARRTLLGAWRGAVPDDLQMRAVVHGASCLRLPQSEVAVGSGSLDGQTGFLVLDGPRSRWYPADEHPPGESATTILELHVGRLLLGFTGAPERKRLLSVPAATPAPAAIVQRYERLLGERTAASGKLLQEHFRTYVTALAACGRGDTDACLVAAHRRVVQWVLDAPPEVQAGLLDHFGAFSDAFEDWCSAADRLAAHADLLAFTRLIRPYWNHNLGKGRLGRAAFLLGDHAEAERLFLELRAALKDWQRHDFIPMLAEIWQVQGRTGESRQLLVDGLLGVAAMVRTSRYASDREMHEGEFQRLREALLRLHPGVAEELFVTHGIPTTTRTA